MSSTQDNGEILIKHDSFVSEVTSQLQLVYENLYPPFIIRGLPGVAVAEWLRHCATSRRVPESIPGHWEFFPGHQTVPRALGSTQPLKMSTRIFLEVKTAGA
jgi:hypothetical protein